MYDSHDVGTTFGLVRISQTNISGFSGIKYVELAYERGFQLVGAKCQNGDKA